MRKSSISRVRCEARARIAKALAHATRLMLLEALQERERCVSELVELVGSDQSTVSKHLAILKSAGLVADRRCGAQSVYRVCCSCLGGFFSCLEAVMQDNLKAQRAACC